MLNVAERTRRIVEYKEAEASIYNILDELQMIINPIYWDGGIPASEAILLKDHNLFSVLR